MSFFIYGSACSTDEKFHNNHLCRELGLTRANFKTKKHIIPLIGKGVVKTRPNFTYKAKSFDVVNILLSTKQERNQITISPILKECTTLNNESISLKNLSLALFQAILSHCLNHFGFTTTISQLKASATNKYFNSCDAYEIVTDDFFLENQIFVKIFNSKSAVGLWWLSNILRQKLGHNFEGFVTYFNSYFHQALREEQTFLVFPSAKESKNYIILPFESNEFFFDIIFPKVFKKYKKFKNTKKEQDKLKLLLVDMKSKVRKEKISKHSISNVINKMFQSFTKMY